MGYNNFYNIRYDMDDMINGGSIIGSSWRKERETPPHQLGGRKEGKGRRVDAMQVDDDAELTFEDACDRFSRASHEERKLLAADGQNAHAASLSLIERLLSHGPRSQAEANADTKFIAPVIERTGFSVEEAARTLLLWQEISSLRKQGLDTVGIVQHLTKRLKGDTPPTVRGRGHLTESGMNAAEGSSQRTKQKYGSWSECEDSPPISPETAKRSRLE